MFTCSVGILEQIVVVWTVLLSKGPPCRAQEKAGDPAVSGHDPGDPSERFSPRWTLSLRSPSAVMSVMSKRHRQAATLSLSRSAAFEGEHQPPMQIANWSRGSCSGEEKSTSYLCGHREFGGVVKRGRGTSERIGGGVGITPEAPVTPTVFLSSSTPHSLLLPLAGFL